MKLDEVYGALKGTDQPRLGRRVTVNPFDEPLNFLLPKLHVMPQGLCIYYIFL